MILIFPFYKLINKCNHSVAKGIFYDFYAGGGAAVVVVVVGEAVVVVVVVGEAVVVDGAAVVVCLLLCRGEFGGLYGGGGPRCRRYG